MHIVFVCKMLTIVMLKCIILSVGALCASCCCFILSVLTVTYTATFKCPLKCITGSAVALQCCKAHSEINRKMENLTPCKIVTPENFILKLGTRDYLDDNTYYTIFDVDRFTGVSPQIGEILPICDFFPSLSFFLDPTPS